MADLNSGTTNATGTAVAKEKSQDFQPENVIGAFESWLNKQLSERRITIDDNGNNYQVTEMRDGFLFVKPTRDQPGGGALQQLPVDEHYAALVLDAIMTQPVNSDEALLKPATRNRE